MPLNRIINRFVDYLSGPYTLRHVHGRFRSAAEEGDHFIVYRLFQDELRLGGGRSMKMDFNMEVIINANYVHVRVVNNSDREVSVRGKLHFSTSIMSGKTANVDGKRAS